MAIMMIFGGLEACSQKSTGSKTTATATSNITETKTSDTPPAPVAAAEEKEGMTITRDAAGNFVIHLIIKELEAVKLMKPVREGYVVWMVNDSKLTSNIGNIEGANTWTAKKDNVKFEATSAVKPAKIFITVENDLKTDKPGTRVVFSTGDF
jgi:hypothetical protein